MDKAARRDVVTLTLFTGVGPWIGLVVWGFINSGLIGIVGAFLAFGFSLALLRWGALLAFLIIGAIPAILSALWGIAARRLQLPTLFIPAAIAGGPAGITLVYYVMGRSVSADLLFIAFIAAVACAVIDVQIGQHAEL